MPQQAPVLALPGEGQSQQVGEQEGEDEGECGDIISEGDSRAGVCDCEEAADQDGEERGEQVEEEERDFVVQGLQRRDGNDAGYALEVVEKDGEGGGCGPANMLANSWLRRWLWSMEFIKPTAKADARKTGREWKTKM